MRRDDRRLVQWQPWAAKTLGPHFDQHIIPDTARLLDISVPTEYLIEANGIRSSTYRIDVVNLPFVKNVNSEYRYASYTGLASTLAKRLR